MGLSVELRLNLTDLVTDITSSRMVESERVATAYRVKAQVSYMLPWLNPSQGGVQLRVVVVPRQRVSVPKEL